VSHGIPFADRLAFLDIVQEDFDLYVRTFVKGYTRYWRRNSYRQSWFQAKHGEKVIPLSKYAVVRHLAGEFWIAKTIPGKTDFFCLDLDRRGRSRRLAERTYRSVCEILANPLVIQSSKSGGLHLYYFLKEEDWRDNLSVLLEKVLHEGGLVIESGTLET
jgi:hypothetical protein